MKEHHTKEKGDIGCLSVSLDLAKKEFKKTQTLLKTS